MEDKSLMTVAVAKIYISQELSRISEDWSLAPLVEVLRSIISSKISDETWAREIIPLMFRHIPDLARDWRY